MTHYAFCVTLYESLRNNSALEWKRGVTGNIQIFRHQLTKKTDYTKSQESIALTSQAQTSN
jgi:hypothetical protein